MSVYFHGGRLVEYYKAMAIYEKDGGFYVVQPATYCCCSYKLSERISNIENCRKIIDDYINQYNGGKR